MFLRRRLFLAAVVAAVLLLMAPHLQAETVRTDLRAALDNVINLVETYYKDPVDRSRLYRGAIRGALQELDDPYTAYLDPQEYREFTESIEGSFTGIGVFIDQVDQYITVVAPIKGSPADRAGLQAGARILEADGKNLVGVPVESATRQIRGPAGTTVILKVERPATGKVFEVPITRAAVQVPIVEQELLPGRIGYIKLYSFSSDAGARFASAVGQLKAEGARGLILDLRDNPGGYLNAAVEVASQFVPKGQTVVRTVARGGRTEDEVSSGGTPVGLPTVVLINKGSASASEILAGALQDYGAATLVGTTSFGKGTVQELLTLGDGSVLKVTVAEYQTPGGRKVHKVGLTPDVLVNGDPVNPDRIREIPVDQTLSWSNVGLDVLAAQQRLNDLGYRAGPENGYFGGALQNAVEQFQKANGLPVTGILDRPTLTRINEQVQQLASKLRQQDLQKDRAVAVLKELMARAGR